MTGSRTAEVIGGGIAGLSGAIALAQRGWNVTLHEQQPAIRAVGAGIYLWENGLKALEEFGAFAEATRGAHIAPAAEARSNRGRSLYRIPLNDPGGTRCYTVLRETLVSALQNAALRSGVTIRTGADCRAVVDGTGAAIFYDGTRSADLVICADGVHSRLRDRVGMTAERVQMRQGAARMMVSARVLDVADTHAEYFGERRRVLVTPCTPEQVYLALVSDADDRPIRGAAVDLADWLTEFPVLAPLADASPGTVIDWANFELVLLTAWSSGSVAFLGDAAHAQPPYLGQGGGTAMTNALSLAEAVTCSTSVTDALADWETKQRPSVEQSQMTSYRMRLLDRLPGAIRSGVLIAAGRIPGVRDRSLAATRQRPAASGTAEATTTGKRDNE